MVPEDVSSTGSIGHSHQINLEGDVLTVAVTDGRAEYDKRVEYGCGSLTLISVRSRLDVEFLRVRFHSSCL